MEKIQTAVSLALRDTETCTTAAEVREIQEHGSLDDLDDRRVLAVITTQSYHKATNGDIRKDEDKSEEEGW